MNVRIGLFGGIYNNYLALEAAISQASALGVDALYCLGDIGAFGPHPDRSFPLLTDNKIECIQGNYDDSIGNELADCQCGYTDVRDNHFAQLSYDYTLANTSEDNKAFLKSLPSEIELEIEEQRLLLCHGSPRKTNEFLWESATPLHFLDMFLKRRNLDLIAGTHTGIKWHAKTNHGQFVNVGVLGRPENDGNSHVWFTTLDISRTGIQHAFHPVSYDHQRLGNEMQREGIPDEFIETIHTGWWTTCLEILPQKERAAGCY
ncbi:MAG: metallophosphoesterase [Planctomycetaceae bacterium]|nr:metallophosphoesterase [Planctomycetaceae bacterium]|tara:strand:- start:127 stop:909 length:783 start_codon:yes stop_codon:yes gene_type:complete